MIQSVKVTNYIGESILMELMHPEKTGFAITEITGLGAGKANINISENATTDGGTYNSGRVPSRNIVLKITAYGTELANMADEDGTFEATVEQIRQFTYKYFPLKKRVHLTIKNDTRSGDISGIVESNEPDIFSKQESFVISIMCEEPYFQKSGSGVVTTFFGVEPLFEFPFENDSPTEPLLEMGEIQMLDNNNVFYEGDSDTGFVMTLYALGPVTDFEIHNLATRGMMKLISSKIEAMTGAGLNYGDLVTINTMRRQKSITLLRNGQYINILNALDMERSTWLTLQKGDNIFAFDCAYGKSNLEFYITNQILYEGL